MRALVSCMFLLGCSSSPSSSAPSSPSTSRHVQSPSAWQHMQRLAGSWSGTADSGGQVDIVVRSIARASTLAETFGPPGRETMTLYHSDGGGLIATHYCAQGNQPRLRATSIAADRIVFE